MTAISRYLTYVILLAAAVVVVVFATSNRHLVAVDLWPAAGQIELPVYMLSLGPLAVGLMLGRLSGSMGALGVRRRAWLGLRRTAKLERELEAARNAGATPPRGGLLARRRAAAGDE